MKPEPEPDRSRVEGLAVVVVTLVGTLLRNWPPGRLGLTHFDEGIYALAAPWAFAPGGPTGIDPVLIPYAPPGYPILIGLARVAVGTWDGAALIVSQLAGILTIPVVAWLARRAFGPGSGCAAAIFACFSGPQIAFSRMGLTDSSFLLAWLLAIGLGMRFLERPGATRALAMGLGVGLAQTFKYNGWLTGGIVILTAALGPLIRPEDRRVASIARVFGWGLMAAVVAGLVVLPWYRFVEAHGGYAALLRHQRSYLGGVGEWWPHFRSQAEQAVALSGGGWLIGPAIVLAGLATALIRPEAWRGVDSRGRQIGRIAVIASCIVPAAFLDSPYWLGLILAPWLLTRADPAGRLIGVWFVLLAVMTPFYHPYARLWLPFHAVNWLLMGWLVPRVPTAILGWSSMARLDRPGQARRRVVAGYLMLTLVAGLSMKWATVHRAAPQPGLLDPSDSLRRATIEVDRRVRGDNVRGLELLVRPPVTYYLAGPARLFPVAGSDQLLSPGGQPWIWAVVDSAILRSESGDPSAGLDRKLLARLGRHWEVVEEFPTTLSLPAVLDLDPAAVRDPSASRSAPLWLLRRRLR